MESYLGFHNLVTTTVDYNNHYKPSGFRVWWKGTAHTTLAAYRTASSQGANAVSINPDYVSATDLHVDSSNAFFDGRGTNVSEVITDIDGEARNGSQPDIGADEFNARTNVAIGSLSSPLNCSRLKASIPISVRIKNLGPYPMSNIPISLILNGNTAVNETHTASIASNDSALHTFTTPGNFSAAGIYSLKIYTSQYGDQETNNDTGDFRIAITSLHIFTNLADTIGVCVGDDLMVDAKGLSSSSFLWSDNSTDKILKLTSSNITAGTTPYWVKVTDVNGCTLNDTIQVIASNPAQVKLGNDTTVCANETLVLGNTLSNGEYTWQDNSTNKTYSVSSAGTYHVNVKTGVSCYTSDTIEVSYSNAINLNFNRMAEICKGDSLILKAGPSYDSYLWNDLSTQSTLTVVDAGEYFVSVEDSIGCKASDTTVVSVNDLPVLMLGDDTMVCDGSIIILEATQSGHVYLWSNNTASSMLSVSDSGTYWLKITNSKNCSIADTIYVSKGVIPLVNLGKDTTICEGTILPLDALNSGATYRWQDASTNASFNVKDAGDYHVQVTGANGCLNRDTVLVATNPKPNIDLGRDTAIGSVVLKNHPLRIQADLGYQSYLWSDGSTNSFIDIDENTGIGAKFYSVIVTNSLGCESFDTIQVEVYDNTSVRGFGNIQLKVYPNPSSGQFTISLEGVKEDVEMTLHDVFARSLIRKKYFAKSQSIIEIIDVSDMPKGTYLLTLSGNGLLRTVKLVVINTI